ncbi:hypothetical protein D9M68_901940 [compost metagenome]
MLHALRVQTQHGLAHFLRILVADVFQDLADLRWQAFPGVLVDGESAEVSRAEVDLGDVGGHLIELDAHNARGER